MKVLFFDNHLVVVEKPAGIPTQPSPHSKTSLEEVVKQWVKEKYKKSGKVFLECIHRLDKKVSGIVIFAKTSKALQRLQKDIREKHVKKIYLALVEGVVKPERGELTHNLSHEKYKALEKKNGKVAILKYKVKKSTKEISLVEIELITGRYHQIRAQFSIIGHPILGDEKYKSHFFLQDKIALHHYKMIIYHPISKEKMEFTSKPSFLSSIEQCRFRTNGQKMSDPS